MRRTTILLLAVLSLLALPVARDAKEAPMQSRFANVDGLRVHYLTSGKGREALVFVHGWTCSSEFWKANLPAFRDRARVIAIDLPGHGESDKPKIVYSMDLFARAIEAVLENALIDRAVLIGHSMGTPVIRQFYRKYPRKTQALVFVDGSLKAMGTRESMAPYLDPLRKLDYLKSAENSVNFLTDKMRDPSMRAEARRIMLGAPQHVMVSAFEEMINPDIWRSEDKILVPALALMAVNPSWNAEYERYVRELVPGIEYEVWGGVSHFLMMDEPKRFNQRVIDFLKKNKLIRKEDD